MSKEIDELYKKATECPDLLWDMFCGVDCLNMNCQKIECILFNRDPEVDS